MCEVLTGGRETGDQVADVVPGGEAEAGEGRAPGEQRAHALRVTHRVTHQTQAGPEYGGPVNKTKLTGTVFRFTNLAW